MGHTPAPSAWQARLWRAATIPALRLGYRVSIVGAERVPDGPVILAANHTGFLDGPLLFAATPRPAHMLVLAETFTGLPGRVLTLSGQIPLRQGRTDRTALARAMEVLARGGVLGIFPEGGRGRGDVAQAGRGVAWLALGSGAPVVPVALLGTRRTGDLAASWPAPRSRLVADFGTAVRVEAQPGVPRRAAVAAGAERIRLALAEHVLTASARHDIALPTDVPPDLVEIED